MPSQPAWFHRLDEILADLRSMTSTRLDRAAVEKLFRVRTVPRASTCRGMLCARPASATTRSTRAKRPDSVRTARGSPPSSRRCGRET